MKFQLTFVFLIIGLWNSVYSQTDSVTINKVWYYCGSMLQAGQVDTISFYATKPKCINNLSDYSYWDLLDTNFIGYGQFGVYDGVYIRYSEGWNIGDGMLTVGVLEFNIIRINETELVISRKKQNIKEYYLSKYWKLDRIIDNGTIEVYESSRIDLLNSNGEFAHYDKIAGTISIDGNWEIIKPKKMIFHYIHYGFTDDFVKYIHSWSENEIVLSAWNDRKRKEYWVK